MFYFLILSFWINQNIAVCNDNGCRAVTGSYDDCSGNGCRVYYHSLPKAEGANYQPRATRQIHWEHRFASQDNIKPTLPNLDQTKWEAVIDKHWKGVLDAKDRPTWDLVAEPWNAAVSLTALELIMTTIQDILSEGLASGSTGYKNPMNPAVAGGPDKQKTIAEINMHDINQMLVSPMTRGLSVPFVSVAKLVDARFGGPITTFISHDWSEPFQNFLATVQKHCADTKCTKATTYYWVCTFANNQWNFDAGNENPGFDTTSPFGKALNQAAAGSPYAIRSGLKSALFIQSDTPAFLNIQRVWCVFELNLLINLKLPIFWGCHDKIVKFEKGAKNPCGKSSKDLLDAWKAETTGVTVESDKTMILKYVEDKPVKTLLAATAADSKGSLKEFLTAFNGAGLPDCPYLTEAAKHTVETKEESSLSINHLPIQKQNVETKVEESEPLIQNSWVTFLGGMFAGMSLLVVVRFARSDVNEKLEQQYSVLLDTQNEC